MAHPSMHGRIGRPALLGIDLGTSSVKAVVTDLDGTLIGQADGRYAVTSVHPGWSESDPHEWLASTIVAVRTAVAAAKVDIIGIGFSGQMHGVVPADERGRPVRPAMLWSDSRATEQLKVYRNLPDGVRARLANPLSPGMAGPLLSWLACNEPDNYSAARWALQPKDWLRTHFTEQFHTEPSDASATLLYDLTRDSWDDDVAAALGPDIEKLAPILPASGSRAGVLTSGGAQLFGMRPGIPVAAGAADTPAAALGSRLTDPGTAQLTIGTGAQVVRPVADLPETLVPRPRTHLYRAATQTGWYSMAASLNGGSTLTWVRTVLGASWQELYDCSATPPRDDAPFFLPHLHGERTPYLDPHMRGAWTDLAPRHSREDLLHAALEGVAFAVREATDSLLLGRDTIPELRLAGGGTKGQAWRQMLADVLEFPVTPVEVPSASGLGAAALAGQAAGITGGARESRPTSSQPTSYPDPELSQFYRQRYTSYRERVHSLRPGRPQPREPTKHHAYVPTGTRSRH